MVGLIIGVLLTVGIVGMLVLDWWRHPELPAEPDEPRRR
jgi:hypothetical protein